MIYKSILLTSLALESVCMVYIASSTRVRSIVVGTKVLRSGGVGFCPTSTTRLSIHDIEGINWEYQRQVDKAIMQGYSPSWSRPACHIKARQLMINFDNA